MKPESLKSLISQIEFSNSGEVLKRKVIRLLSAINRNDPSLLPTGIECKPRIIRLEYFFDGKFYIFKVKRNTETFPVFCEKQEVPLPRAEEKKTSYL